MIEATSDIEAGDGAMETFTCRKVYDRPAAERHWERLVGLYGRIPR